MKDICCHNEWYSIQDFPVVWKCAAPSCLALAWPPLGDR